MRMGIVCTTYALCGMMDVMVGGLRGIGYSIMPMLVSLVGACGLRLLWIATIFQLPQFHTIQTIYWSYPISWAITFGVHVICFLWAMKRSSASCCRRARPRRWKSPHFGRGDRFRIRKKRREPMDSRRFSFYSPSRCLTASTAQATRKMVSASCPHSRL